MGGCRVVFVGVGGEGFGEGGSVFLEAGGEGGVLVNDDQTGWGVCVGVDCCFAGGPLRDGT